jgi:ABC-type molybdate transport system substrate-binding protein
MKLSILLVITSLLAGCLGPELFTIAGIKVTAGTAITVPHKIEVYDKYKKEQENKKRFEVNKLDEKTFEIYY